MHLFIKKGFVVVLALVALCAPTMSATMCANSTCVAGSEDCVCLCHVGVASDLACHESSETTLPRIGRLVSLGTPSPESLLATDIFRPPISV